MNVIAVLAIALALIAYGLISRKIEGSILTGPILFTVSLAKNEASCRSEHPDLRPQVQYGLSRLALGASAGSGQEVNAGNGG